MKTTRNLLKFTFAVTLGASGIQSASAALVLNNATGAVAFGVANYGGPPVPNPTYIPNDTNGLVDVMTSPGNGFLTANTSNVNNVASFAGALPGGAAWVGGGNGNGAFGSGAVQMTDTNVYFNLTDINPDGAGAASFAIGTWTSTFTSVGPTAGTLGSWLTVGGTFTSINSAAAVSLRTQLDGVGGIFGAGTTIVFPQLVLAAAANGNFQALGGTGALVVGNAFGWQGLAVNNLGLFNMVGGEVLTVRSTLTAIADPAAMNSIIEGDLDPSFNTLLGQLPSISVNNTIPESSALLCFIPMLGIFALRRRR
jgi:hypothetical protein